MYNLEEVEKKVNQFDKMKFIDTDGKEKISGRDLAKAMGYSDWRNFKQAVERANNQIKASGGTDSEMIGEVTTHREIKHTGNANGIETRTITDYNLTRRQAINVANNCDTRKPEVAMVQEWLYDSSEIGEKAKNIYNKMKDRDYIDKRNKLKLENKKFTGACLDCGTKRNELGIVYNACDEALYHMSTKEIKEQYGKGNRTKDDFLGSDDVLTEEYAKMLSTKAIKREQPYGVDGCTDIAVAVHSEIREQYTRITGTTPEESITGEDIRDVRKRYNKLTKKQMKEITKDE